MLGDVFSEQQRVNAVALPDDAGADLLARSGMAHVSLIAPLLSDPVAAVCLALLGGHVLPTPSPAVRGSGGGGSVLDSAHPRGVALRQAWAVQAPQVHGAASAG